MSRPLPSSIVAMLADPGATLKLARCMKLRLRDGTELGFTDLDEDVEVALDDDLGYPVTYQSGFGAIVGDITLAVGLAADNTEFSVPISSSVTRAAVLGKRFNRAVVWLFDIDHSAETPAPGEIMKGRISDSRIEGSRAVFEVRSDADYWNLVVGSVLSPRCRADFGDAWCGKEVVNISATVTAVASALTFTLGSISGDYTDQYFRFGEVEFVTGPLAGTPPREVVQSAATGVIEVFDPLVALPGIGDSVLIRQGCSRLKSSEDPTLPTCLYHENVTRFRGFDRVPGSDVYLRMTQPGSTGVSSGGSIGTWV